MRKLTILILLAALVAIAGPPALGGPAGPFVANLPGVAVKANLPDGWSKDGGATTPNKFVLKGPNGARITITLLPAAQSVDAPKTDNICRDRLAQLARVESIGTRVAHGTSAAVSYTARTAVGSDGKAHGVGVVGSSVAGVLFHLEGPSSALANLGDDLASIIKSVSVNER